MSLAWYMFRSFIRQSHNTLSRAQARWGSNTWALSLRSDFVPLVTNLVLKLFIAVNGDNIGS